MLMKIAGVSESLAEWPGHFSYVIFISGCNFNCPWCYVPHLLNPEKTNNISEEEILERLQERKEFIDAVCISGGEPTIHKELFNFLKKIKNLGFKIRIESNGSNPAVLEELIKSKLIDSLALDIKTSKEKYMICGLDNIKKIEKSIEIAKSLEDYELRTTLVPGIHDEQEILKIADWIADNSKEKIKLYVLQQFRADLPNESTLDRGFIEKGNFPIGELKRIKNSLEKRNVFEKVLIRSKEF